MTMEATLADVFRSDTERAAMMLGCTLARLPGSAVADWTFDEKNGFLTAMMMPEWTAHGATPRVVAKAAMIKKMLEDLGVGTHRRAVWCATSALLDANIMDLHAQFRVFPGEPDPPEPEPAALEPDPEPAALEPDPEPERARMPPDVVLDVVRYVIPENAPSETAAAPPNSPVDLTQATPSPPPSPMLGVGHCGFAAASTERFLEQVWRMPMRDPRPRDDEYLHVISTGEVYYCGASLHHWTVKDLESIGLTRNMPLNGRYIRKDELLAAIEIYVARMHGATCAAQKSAALATAAREAMG
jgi:hypothetical protein